MSYKNISFLLIISTLFLGCSAKTKGFIEDIYSETEVRKAVDQDYVDRGKTIAKKESISNSQKSSDSYIDNISQIYSAKGKIIDASFDKDVNLYIYVFLEDGKSDPVIFYYNRDLRPIGKKVIVKVKDNFLQNITQEIPSKSGNRKFNPSIKAPSVEKIETL